MLVINQLMINVLSLKGKSQDDITLLLKGEIVKASGIKASPQDIKEMEILKKSLDARKKPEIFYSYSVRFSVDDEKTFLKKNKSKKIGEYTEKKFKLPEVFNDVKRPRPVVCGFGPAGIAAAYVLAKTGRRPIVIERGESVDERKKSVESFWNGGKLKANSNVQFGEGGAGAFSDGKLNTGNKDKDGMQRAILKTLVSHGAPENLLYDAKPHVGTDLLCKVVKNIREDIKNMGGDFFFNTTLKDIKFSENGGTKQIERLIVSDERGDWEITTDTLILAIGHSARDTFGLLKELGISLSSKPFAVGYRVIHLQSYINETQYGSGWEEKELPSSSYKLTYTAKSGRPVFSFCMCPGGYVVNSASTQNALCVNGMSYSKRDGNFANSAIVMGISPDELPKLTGEAFGDPLLGMRFQEELEKKAYEAGNGRVPFCGLDKPQGAYKGEVCYVPNMIDDNLILPGELNRDYLEAMEGFSKYMKGFKENALMVSGVESRTSSPVRIVRGDGHESVDIKGLYPCGEGAGYAGGIMSAAMDGVRSALSSIL